MRVLDAKVVYEYFVPARKYVHSSGPIWHLAEFSSLLLSAASHHFCHFLTIQLFIAGLRSVCGTPHIVFGSASAASATASAVAFPARPTNLDNHIKTMQQPSEISQWNFTTILTIRELLRWRFWTLYILRESPTVWWIHLPDYSAMSNANRIAWASRNKMETSFGRRLTCVTAVLTAAACNSVFIICTALWN